MIVCQEISGNCINYTFYSKKCKAYPISPQSLLITNAIDKKNQNVLQTLKLFPFDGDTLYYGFNIQTSVTYIILSQKRSSQCCGTVIDITLLFVTT